MYCRLIEFATASIAPRIWPRSSYPSVRSQSHLLGLPAGANPRALSLSESEARSLALSLSRSLALSLSRSLACHRSLALSLSRSLALSYRINPGSTNWQVAAADWIWQASSCALETRWLGVRKTCGIGLFYRNYRPVHLARPFVRTRW